jgi:hypothetical protein
VEEFVGSRGALQLLFGVVQKQILCCDGVNGGQLWFGVDGGGGVVGGAAVEDGI